MTGYSAQRDCAEGSSKLRILLLLSVGVFLATQLSAQVKPVGLQGMWITALAAEQSDGGEMWSPGTANLLFAATKGQGIHQGYTWDDGPRWSSIGPLSSPPADATALTVQHWGAGPRDGLHLLAAFRADNGIAGSPLLLRREIPLGDPSSGEWVHADSGLTRGDTSSTIHALAAYYYTGHTPPQPVLGSNGNGFLRGQAAGVFWEEGGQNEFQATSIDVTPKWFGTDAWATGVLKQGRSEAALFRSTDQGVSWTSYPMGALEPKPVKNVTVCPGHPDTLFAALPVNVLLSTDGMDSWWHLPVHSGSSSVAFAFDPLNISHVYVAMRPGFSVYRSTNLGKNWQHLPVPPDVQPSEITCMTMAMIDTIPMGRLPRRGLFLGTAGTGVWMYDIDMLPVDVETVPPPVARDLAIHPNPAKDAVTLELALPSAGSVAVEFRDLLGRMVNRCDFGALGAGKHTLGIRTAGLPSGLYIVRIVGSESFAPELLRVLR